MKSVTQKGRREQEEMGRASHCKERREGRGLRRKSIQTRVQLGWSLSQANCPVGATPTRGKRTSGPALNPYRAESWLQAACPEWGFWTTTVGPHRGLLALDFTHIDKWFWILHLTENNQTCALYCVPFNFIICLNADFLKTSGKPVIHAVYIACPLTLCLTLPPQPWCRLKNEIECCL